MAGRKKYQVFISSTYEDLKEERKAVEEAVIRAGDLPVGMEAFPAADEEIFDFIKTIIDDCDYYVLLVAGRYGQFSPDGRSYTEKEFDYALEKGIPVLVMLHGDRGALPASNVERSELGQKALDRFIEKVSTGRLRKEWRTTDGLKLVVREALDHAKATKTRPGWIKGDLAPSMDVLEEVNQLRKEKELLVAKLASMTPPTLTSFSPAGLDATVQLSGKYNWRDSRSSLHPTEWSRTATVGQVFEKIAPHLIDSCNQLSVANLVGEHFVKKEGYGAPVSGSEKADEETLVNLRIQLEAAGLLTVFRSKTVGGHVGSFWQLTDLGRKEMYERRVIRKA